MRVSMDRLGVLTEYGLSEYQARVYLALLEFPSVPAGALAKAAQVPRNRLYEVLEELQSMGLADIILEDTRKYRARPISSFLDRAVSDLRDRIGKIEGQKAYLDLAFHPPEMSHADDLEAGSTRVAMSRRAVAREIDRLVESAQTSLVAACSVGGWERVFRHLEKLDPDGPVTVEIYVPREAASAGGVERLAERWGAAVRWIEPPLRSIALAIDERELMLVHPVPDDATLRTGQDFALLTTNAALVGDQIALLRSATPWK